MVTMRMVDLIGKKRNGKSLSEEEIEFFIDGYMKEKIPDYQVSALMRSEEHTSELQSRPHLVCRLLLEKKKGDIGSVFEGLQKLSSQTGDADDGWDPRPDTGVYALSVDGNGNLYVGGRFTVIAGQARWGYAVLGPYKIDLFFF